MNENKDIIDLPHYEPKQHPRMPMVARAAQFAPFAALTGYDAAIGETARLTDAFTERGDEGDNELNRKFAVLLEQVTEHPTITISYFLPDERKAGGSYQTKTASVRRIDEVERTLELADGTKIPLEYIVDIEGEEEKDEPWT